MTSKHTKKYKAVTVHIPENIAVALNYAAKKHKMSTNEILNDGLVNQLVELQISE